MKIAHSNTSFGTVLSITMPFWFDINERAIYQISASATTTGLVSVYWDSSIVGRFEPMTLWTQNIQAHPLTIRPPDRPLRAGIYQRGTACVAVMWIAESLTLTRCIPHPKVNKRAISVLVQSAFVFDNFSFWQNVFPLVTSNRKRSKETPHWLCLIRYKISKADMITRVRKDKQPFRP